MTIQFWSVLRPLSGRLFHSLLTLWMVTILFFLIIEFAPGDYANASAGRFTSFEMMKTTRYQIGLNLSAPERYFNWLIGLLHGDLGTSWWARQPITPLITERLWHSTWLFTWATVITVPISLVLALIATARRNGIFDRSSSVISLAAMSLPDFFIAYGLMFLLAVHFHVFPVHSFYALEMPWSERLYASALPIMSLAAVTITPMFRLSKAALQNVLAHEYIQMAELKGLSPARVIVRHALPNALGPIANAVALALANLFFGLVIIEVIFSYPGLGNLLVIAAKLQDIPLAQACGLISAVVYIGFSLLADGISVITNPRLRFPNNPTPRSGFFVHWRSNVYFKTSFLVKTSLAVLIAATVIWAVTRPQESNYETISPPAGDVRKLLTAAELLGERPQVTKLIHYDYFKPFGRFEPARHVL